MNDCEKIKKQIQYKMENRNSFQYWIENHFIEFFLRECGNYFNEEAEIQVSVELTDGQLRTWGMTGHDVRKHLEDNGFTTTDHPLVREEYKELCFRISFQDMDIFLKEQFSK